MVVNRIEIEMIVVQMNEVVGVDWLEIVVVVVVVVWTEKVGIVVVLGILRPRRRRWLSPNNWLVLWSSFSVLINIPSWIGSNRLRSFITSLVGIVFTLNSHFDGRG